MENLSANARIMRHTGGTFTQAFIEGEVALPVGKPEMARVLMVRGRAETGSIEALEGRAMTDGTLTLSVCYLCQEGQLHAFESVSTFKHTAEVEGAQAGMSGYASAHVASVETTLTDSRRINVSAIIDIMFEIQDEVNLSYCAAEETPGLYTQTAKLPLLRRCARATTATEIRGEVMIPQDLPTVSQVLCCEGYAQIQNAFAETDTLCLEGELKLCIAFASEDEEMPIAQFYPSLFFSEMLNAPGAMPGQTVCARAKIKDLFARPSEDGMELHIEAVCAIEIDAEEPFELSVLADAYAVDGDVVLGKQTVVNRSRAASCQGMTTVRETAKLGHAPKRTLAVFSMPSAVKAEPANDTISMESVIITQVIYIDQSDQLQALSFEFPVRLEEPAPGFSDEMSIQAKLNPAQAQATMMDDGFDVRVLMHWQAEGFMESTANIVSNVSVQPMEVEASSAIVVYFVQPGETIWQVAKRYRVDPVDIMRHNPDICDPLEPGCKLILFCRRTPSHAVL